MSAATKRAKVTPQSNLKNSPAFVVPAFLDSARVARKVVTYRAQKKIYEQGDPAANVIYVQAGGVRLSVINESGKEAVVAILGPGDFLGEGCLAGQSIRLATATTMSPTTVLVIAKNEMTRVLHAEHEFSDRFVAYMLARNIQVEADLVDQLFNSTEKRLARTLLLLANFNNDGELRPIVPKISQEVLAARVGTTRSRINYFMNKFRKLGMIEYNGSVKVHPGLLNVIVHD